MDKSVQLFSVGSFKVRMESSAVVGWVVMVAIGANLVMFIYGANYADGLRFGMLYWLIHFGGILTHYLGHIIASHWVRHPMTGLEFWWIFGRSLYPSDEPALRPRQHWIQLVRHRQLQHTAAQRQRRTLRIKCEATGRGAPSAATGSRSSRRPRSRA